jgi:hypothetical protein
VVRERYPRAVPYSLISGANHAKPPPLALPLCTNPSEGRALSFHLNFNNFIDLLAQRVHTDPTVIYDIKFIDATIHLGRSMVWIRLLDVLHPQGQRLLNGICLPLSSTERDRLTVATQRLGSWQVTLMRRMETMKSEYFV